MICLINTQWNLCKQKLTRRVLKPGYVTLFAVVCLCINWILKMTVQVCYFHTIILFYRHWNWFLSSVSTNGKDVCGLKVSLDAMSAKITRKVFSLVLFDEICLIYIFFITLKEHFVYGQKNALSNKFSSELSFAIFQTYILLTEEQS